MSAAPAWATAAEAIADLRRGRMVVVCDGDEHEGEAAVTLAAQFATAEAINFMARHARGLICLALTPQRCDDLGLEPMAARNASPRRTSFMVSIEARRGVTTGVSAADRARTIQVAVDPKARPADLVQPGHMFPLMARAGGVLEHRGQAEAAVDLARLAGLLPAGVICGVMNEDGTTARVGDLVPYCERHGLRMVAVADVVAHRCRTETLVERVAVTSLPTAFGDFTAVGYRSRIDERHQFALVKGDVAGADDVLVRVHTECLTGDVFHSLRCDCADRLEEALRTIEREGRGVVVYLSRERRPAGAVRHARVGDEEIGAQILADLGLSSTRRERTAA